MNKFNFKLQGLLKVRIAREKQVKAELGVILSEIQKNKDTIQALNNDIDEAYKNQEAMMDKAVNAKFLEFHPYYVKSKKAHIDVVEKQIDGLQSQYEKKIEELKQKKADVKLIEKLKEKQMEKHVKYVEKKQQEAIEENHIMKGNREGIEF
ncbi:MAG: flagellar export protein FliJ [Bdellovibrionales bacterium RIFOXYD12_FULL_39_22]|nr:MAG: flagellar export protein FliJ [Bdellovibrionales bacterium RIFOXYB1_FULL_39_21]OFZ42132.1 MAG: flagellar export protein FliJ [Bdellovibrionales bacterium RIFOXYC12_FULL_39_17]OFZ50848.1 MAG: flagellar export protein FliJ [Bdellovibrionales bacterium RIFOXYC1_FULL_39_130]OFZ73314.1 MAG: flagellar export protein FliJ [Bdellovibrionales bacterium RIFOXYC2_FULL_39_8]OFZ78071.1 MAG: flagellar export protein FliJ [Bdellovibrionales bacterium RIFOXYD1_FULL_39_84]OFZ93492.1 MAG: flagellar expo